VAGKASISGAVNFPKLNSLVKQAAAVPTVAPTVTVRDLAGNIVANAAAGSSMSINGFTGVPITVQ
jgi:hypothetical protein